MFSSAGRGAIAALLSIGLVAAQLLPQEHIHHTDVDHPSQTKIHRHFDAHAAHGATTDHGVVAGQHDNQGPDWLSSPPAPAPRSLRHVAPVLVLVAHPEPATEPAAPSGRLSESTSRLSVHDPPFLRLAGLRAPPSRV